MSVTYVKKISQYLSTYGDKANSPLMEFIWWLLFVVVAWFFSADFANENLAGYKWGPASWPRAILLMIVFAAGVQCLQKLLAAKAAARTQSEPALQAQSSQTQSSPAGEQEPSSMARVWLLFAVAMIYVLSMRYVGFYFSSMVFLVACLYIMGERRPLFLCLIPITIFLVINIIFTSLLYVPLPTGTLPGFYDFSNWFIILWRTF